MDDITEEHTEGIHFQECSEDLLYFGISGTIDQQSSLVTRVKFRVETFHGEAGGLQFLAVHGPIRKSSL